MPKRLSMLPTKKINTGLPPGVTSAGPGDPILPGVAINTLGKKVKARSRLNREGLLAFRPVG